jgi:hypothetical protein
VPGGYFLASSIEIDRYYCQDKYNVCIRVYLEPKDPDDNYRGV